MEGILLNYSGGCNRFENLPSNSIQNLCDIIPRMRTERNEKSIDIYLTAKEVNAIQEGQTISDRPGVTMPDAKVEVLP